MIKSLPIAIVIPHSGLSIPSELNGRIALTPAQIFNEADVYADQIYDYQDLVLHWVSFPIARAIIDVNRSTDPALNRPGDGVVKRQTSYGDAVFHPGQEPDEALEAQLIETYWKPWHEKMAEITADPRVKLVLDCHTMASVGPSRYDDPGQMRPRVDVANLGTADNQIHPERGRLSAPADLTQMAAEQFRESFARVSTLAPVGVPVLLNTPFWGGWNLLSHGGHQQPWLMLELNRALYVGPQKGNSPIVPPDTMLMTILRQKIWQALERIVDNM